MNYSKRTPAYLVLIIVLVLVLVGCPYTSTVSLAEPSEEVDAGFYGRWLKDSEDEHPDYYDIEELDGLSFSLSKYTWDSDDEVYSLDTTYSSWFTTIGNVRFMNIEDVDDQGTYYFYKMEMPSADTFILYEVTDNIDEVFSDSAGMYAFFDNHKNLSFFYNSDEETYNRKAVSSGSSNN